MRTLKLTIAYDGTDYAGWQRQVGVSTVQDLLETALSEIEGRAVTVYGAGRTDAGVHALGQVVSTRLSHTIKTLALQRALNAKLPQDIRILSIEEVIDSFHARYGACAKLYRYRLSTGLVANPLDQRYTWYIPQSLDSIVMQEAALTLCGKHDFSAFRTSANETMSESTVRTILTLNVSSESTQPWLMSQLVSSCDVIVIDVIGDGFLRHMVRTIVGTLVEVGIGRRSVEDVAKILASRRRECAGPTAPAKGLFLMRVNYEVMHS